MGTKMLCVVCGRGLPKGSRKPGPNACFRSKFCSDACRKQAEPAPVVGCVHIPLTRDDWAIIDEIDLPVVSQYIWSLVLKGKSKNKYATASINGEATMMHQLVWGGMRRTHSRLMAWIDHIDRNGRNNRRGNLRETTPTHNAWNRSKHGNNTSGYTHVYFEKTRSHWKVEVMVHGQHINGGFYHDPMVAAVVSDRLVVQRRGNLAVLNFPEKLEEYCQWLQAGRDPCEERIRANRSAHKRRVDNESGFIGVNRAASSVARPWTARVQIGKQRVFLGRFATPEEAARAYDEAVRRHFGEAGRFNFPDGPL